MHPHNLLPVKESILMNLKLKLSVSQRCILLLAVQQAKPYQSNTFLEDTPDADRVSGKHGCW